MAWIIDERNIYQNATTKNAKSPTTMYTDQHTYLVCHRYLSAAIVKPARRKKQRAVSVSERKKPTKGARSCAWSMAGLAAGVPGPWEGRMPGPTSVGTPWCGGGSAIGRPRRGRAGLDEGAPRELQLVWWCCCCCSAAAAGLALMLLRGFRRSLAPIERRRRPFKPISDLLVVADVDERLRKLPPIFEHCSAFCLALVCTHDARTQPATAVSDMAAIKCGHTPDGRRAVGMMAKQPPSNQLPEIDRVDP